ncbi:MAG: hypothetical protein JO167_06770 [Alphaproteobacteria bacterium]|nr:hypothetical protein [Alphaproteobacteria bacterium]MBV9905055.1 hypothetical protein [Alphaproteobacteria bacterium]
MPKHYLLAGAAAALAFSALPAQAGSWGDCQGKIDRAVSRYETAVDRYGEDSDKAYKEGLKVREIKRKCHDLWGRWYDPRGGGWGRGDDYTGRSGRGGY